MKINELLDLMGDLSIGNDNAADSERYIFLKYLNLAHLELYQKTAGINQELLTSVNLSNAANNNEIILPDIPFIINSVYDITNKKKLQRISMADVIEKDPSFKETGTPYNYFIQGKVVQFYPVQTVVLPVVIWYIPQPVPFTLQTQEEDIPYPIAFHTTLVDGALYYLFQEEGGFKNSQKANEASKRWIVGKSSLSSYLYYSAGQRIGTFSNV